MLGIYLLILAKYISTVLENYCANPHHKANIIWIINWISLHTMAKRIAFYITHTYMYIVYIQYIHTYMHSAHTIQIYIFENRFNYYFHVRTRTLHRVAEAAPPPAAEEEMATEAQWMLLCTFASHELAVCRLKWQMKANSTMENEERERLNSERLHMDMAPFRLGRRLTQLSLAHNRLQF